MFLLHSSTTTMRRVSVGLLALVLSLSGAAASANPRVLLDENFDTFPAGSWTDGSVHQRWLSRYDGYGRNAVVTRDGDRTLQLTPRRAARSDQTHAGLVTSKAAFGNQDVTVRLRTTRQLRASSPNPWEVAWLLWNYQDDTHFYYMALKPNGWELGKADPRYRGAQRFLKTGSTPRFAIGVPHEIRVRHVGATMTVWADGVRLTTFTDRERPYRSGSIGLYTEDAQVQFEEVEVRTPRR